MQIKKYVAQTLREATEKMKAEIGIEAVILGTRVIESDMKLGIKKMFEITAGFDEELQNNNRAKVEANNSPETLTSSFDEELKKIKQRVYFEPQSAGAKDNYVSTWNSQPALNKSNQIDIETELKEIINNLVYKEVQKPIITSVLEQLKKYRDVLTKENLESYTLSILSSLIATSSFELKPQKVTKTVALVGPTGVGKTTGIAKLALIAKIIHNLDVGIISIDTYRLGALDQLRIFSEVSQIEMLAAYEPDEMPGLMKKFAKKDIVFIDTAGRSQNNAGQLKNNLGFLQKIKIDETFLVLSATSSTKNMIDTASKFKIFNYSSFIISKIDESVTLGNILNLTSKTGSPIVFLTNGQVIPDDILAADSEYLAKMIYSDIT